MSSNRTRIGQDGRAVAIKRRQNGLAVRITCFVLILGALAYIAFRLLGGASSSDYEGTGNGETALVEVVQGTSMSELAPQLVEKDIVKSESAFYTAAANNPKASSIKPGFFKLQKQQSAESAVSAILDPANAVKPLEVAGGATLENVVVVGGDVRYGIYSLISQVTCEVGTCVTKDDLEKVASTVDPEQLGAPSWALDSVRARGSDPKRLEGLIAPGQYILDPNMSAQELLTDLVTRSTAKYENTDIVSRAQAINLTPYQLLTAASLVEREAPAGEFDKVARVILNRLATPMRLELDSTVNYGLPDVELATTDAARAQVTPWNTYAMDGLPETPIASPSDEAVKAMESPASGAWKFFVTVDNNGTTVFSDTYEEHLANVNQAINNGVLDSQRTGSAASSATASTSAGTAQ